MLEDILILISLAILLLALIWLLARLVSAMRAQRLWMKGWDELAARYGLTFNGGYTHSSIAGMYQGRIIHLLGTFRSGMAIQMTTNNYTSNNLVLKAKGLPITRRSPDADTQFNQGFTLECRSPEFTGRLFLSPTLRWRLAPLAATPGLVLSLSGEELSLATLHLYYKPEDVLVFSI